jgi:hypothetical protein
MSTTIAWTLRCRVKAGTVDELCSLVHDLVASSEEEPGTQRYEWFVDDDGFATGLSQTLQEVTLTGEYKASGGLITRFEFRTDFSDEDYFIKDDGLKSSQPTASVSFIYAFSSK